AALDLLARLGLVEPSIRNPQAAIRNGTRLTALGEQARRVPLHPRLARVRIEARGSRAIAVACERLAERRSLRVSADATTSDVLTIVDDVRLDIDEREFRRAIFAGYPDRVARRRAAGSRDVLLSTGTGAVIG